MGTFRIRSDMAALLTFAMLGAFPAPSVAVPPCVGPSCGLPLDHFKCYQARTTPNTTKFTPLFVDVQDQFATNTGVLVKRPDKVCNPVSKNGSPVIDSTAHLACYATKPTKILKQDIVINNQFGKQTLTVLKPYQICLPTKKGVAPAPPQPSALLVDHFRCYKAKPAKGSFVVENVPVTLADQFETRPALVMKCLRYCTPVDKNGEGIMNASGHLTCYKLIRDPNDLALPFPRKDLNIDNQFGPDQVTARPLPHLCVPTVQSPSGAFLD